MRRSTVVDSLPITHHYIQDGKTLKRRNMEKMLLTTNDAAPFIKKAKKHRAASNLIGFSLWGISLGITISQLTSILKDVKEEKPPITTEMDKFMLPLSIGGEISSLFQTRFNARANYFTRKGVIVFNDQLCRDRGLEIQYNHHIEKSELKKTWYIQDSVDMSPETVYLVLRENPASKDGATMSLIYREIATRSAGVGLSYLLVAIIGALEDDLNKGYLSVGISTTTFSIITAIASMVRRKRAIREYNEAVPARIKCGQEH
jgi:hypothetical protein